MVTAILAGVAAGIIGGLGLGGGTILIPVLIFCLSVAQKTAQGVNLIFFIPTAIVALFIHIKNKQVELRQALIISLFGALGVFAGFHCASLISQDKLRRFFGVLLLMVGAFEIFKKKKN